MESRAKTGDSVPAFNTNVGLAVLAALLGLPIAAKMFTDLSLLWLGVWATTLGFVWLAFHLDLPASDDSGARFPPLVFTEDTEWAQEVAELEKEAAQPENTAQIYPENFLINDTLNNIVALVVRDFVQGWFSHISSHPAFTVGLKSEFAAIIGRLQSRLASTDFTDVLVYRLVPILDTHLRRFVKAKENVRKKQSAGLSGDHLDKALAFGYNRGRLHEAVGIDDEPANQDAQIKQYLSIQVDKILPLLLSESEADCPAVRIIVREIVAGVVLFPVVSMLSDPDFYNQRIADRLSSVMKERDDVRRFRNILNHHSLYAKNVPTALEGQPEILKKLRVNVNTSAKTFTHVIRYLARCKSVKLLRQYQYVVQLQLGDLAKAIDIGSLNVAENVPLKVYSKRLQILLAAVDSRIAALTDKEDGEVAFDPATIPKRMNLTVAEILRDPLKFGFFLDFMDTKGKNDLVHFCGDVHALRNPLEDLSTGYLNDDMLQAKDLRQIWAQYLEPGLVRVEPGCFETVRDFVQTQPDDPQRYHGARRSLFQAQEKLCAQMQAVDVPAFKQSEAYIRMLAAGTRKAAAEPVLSDEDEVNGDPLAAYDEIETSGDDEEEETEDDSKVVSSTVLTAVEDALNEITKAPEELSPQVTGSTTSKQLRRDVFGEVDEEDEYEVSEGPTDSERSSSNTSANRLFSDEVSTMEGDEESDNDSMSSSMVDSTADVRVAAPGDLNLANEILRLDTELANLQRQLLIIHSLLEKAQLTKNTTELKILHKSMAGLQREVELRELQRQQYAVQQNENSLYERSKVNIQSYITASEGGKEFVLYIIEVQRLSVEHPGTVVAGWVVTRRFSQFYKVHKYLKTRYPEVAEIPFPKRKVVLKFQQSSLIEERKRQLEAYLRQLIQHAAICSDKVFRDFLSSEVFTLDMDERRPAGTVYNKLWNQLMYFQPGALASESRELPAAKPEEPKGLRRFNSTLEMRQELSSLDKRGSEESSLASSAQKMPFVKPLCDIVVTLFQLNKARISIGGRALVIVLQQVLGSTIEKVVRGNVDEKLKQEATVFAVLSGLQNTLWPDGEFRKHSKERTVPEKMRTMRKARYVLTMVAIDVSSRLFGRDNAKYAAQLAFDSLQNRILNRHLVLSLVDEILQGLFAEGK